jgi:hypothetical protein
MAYYVVEDEHLIERLDEFFKRRNEVRKAAITFIRENIPDADQNRYYPGDGINSLGGIQSVIFKGAPETRGWVQDKRAPERAYRPSATLKCIAELRKKWYNLPKVKWDELNEIVGFNPEDSFKLNVNKYTPHPAVNKTSGIYTISLGSQWDGIYQPPKGMREVTYTEMKALQVKGEEDKLASGDSPS